MKKAMLIGGGGVGRGRTSYETETIDKEIVRMTEKEKPNFLFIGLASLFSDSYYDTMKKIYTSLGCTCAYLKKKNIINNKELAIKKIKDADIIYICGGDTIKLITEIKEYELDQYLYEAYNNGTVLAGISAGAILLSRGGFSDAFILRRESEKHVYIAGLDIIDIDFCPHYESNSTKTKELLEYLKKNNKSMYCLENCTALKIIDDEYTIIKSNPNREAYLYKKLKKEKITAGNINNIKKEN